MSNILAVALVGFTGLHHLGSGSVAAGPALDLLWLTVVFGLSLLSCFSSHLENPLLCGDDKCCHLDL